MLAAKSTRVGQKWNSPLPYKMQTWFCATIYDESRDAGTTGAAGASAPLAFCIFNFVGAVRVQTMGVTGAQNFYNRQN